MTDPVKRGRNNRRKGGSYEREVAEALRAIFPNAKRTIGQARSGAEAPDITGTPFWIECGIGSTVTGEKKLRQACEDWSVNGTFHMPLAITRKHNADSTVTMRLQDWIDMAQAAMLTKGWL